MTNCGGLVWKPDLRIKSKTNVGFLTPPILNGWHLNAGNFTELLTEWSHMSDYYDGSFVEDLPLFANPSVVAATERPSEETSSERCAAMLERLLLGPLSTRDAETYIHRGQAIIGDLRSRGYVIDTVDGEYVYRRGPGEELKRVSREVQDAYYQTPHWVALAKRRKEIDGYRCVQCGSSDELEAHHWRYRLFSEDVYRDLCTFCKPCHLGNIHDAAKGSSMHFPRQLPQRIIDRIVAESGVSL